MRRRLAALSLAAALGLPGAAAACGLELILAIDVSGSIDEGEFAIQLGGLADAFVDDGVIGAIERTEGGVLVTMTQWSGVSRQRQMVGWSHVTDRASAERFAAEMRGAGRAWRNFSTAIGEALAHAVRIGAEAPAACRRRVIDISGDGASNEGRRPRTLADSVAAAGYTINALVIRGADPDPLEEYMLNVIAGPGAFVEVAETFADYPDAIRRKLLREIEQPMAVSQAAGAGPSPALPAGSEPARACSARAGPAPAKPAGSGLAPAGPAPASLAPASLASAGCTNASLADARRAGADDGTRTARSPR